MSRQPPYLDTQIADFPNEEWKDVIDYEGSYSISNLGRIRSEDRYRADGAHIRERILKQHVGKRTGDTTVIFSVDNSRKTCRTLELVGRAFLGKKGKKEEYCHVNKVKTDNQLSNIIKTSGNTSYKIGYKLGVRIDWGIKQIALDEKRDYLNKNGVYEKDILIGLICIGCKKELSLSEFSKRGDDKYSRKCKLCERPRIGIKDPGKIIRRRQMTRKGLRVCNKCGYPKNLELDFTLSKNNSTGRAYTCKDCMCVISAKNREKEKQEKQKRETSL